MEWTVELTWYLIKLKDAKKKAEAKQDLYDNSIRGLYIDPMVEYARKLFKYFVIFACVLLVLVLLIARAAYLHLSGRAWRSLEWT